MEAGEMDKIKVKRLLVAGLITLFVFVVVEYILEFVGFEAFIGLGKWIDQLLYGPSGWSVSNHILNLLIALVNSIMLIWMYAALRPMFGVGPKAALIASGFAYAFIFSISINFTDSRLYPIQPALIELFYQLIEIPVAILAGAYYYEGGWEEVDQPVVSS
jgi:hypothetical protein